MITAKQAIICHKIANEFTERLTSDGYKIIKRSNIRHGVRIETTSSNVYTIVCQPQKPDANPNVDDTYTIKQQSIAVVAWPIHSTTTDTVYLSHEIKSMVNYYYHTIGKYRNSSPTSNRIYIPIT